MARHSIRTRESGRHQARWYDDAGARHTKMFDTRTEAKRFLDRVSADRQRGDYLDPRDAQRRFGEVAEEWLATKVKRPKTLAGYESLLRVHLLPTFGPRPVGGITSYDVRRWLAEMQRKGSAPGTVRNAYRVLKPVLDAAVEMGCMRANPCGVLKRDDLPRAQRSEMLFLTAAEVERLAREVASPYDVVVRFAARTGMRAGEIAALRMANVDLLRGRVAVKESISEVGGVQHFVPPKTGEARTVVLPASLVRELRDYVAGQASKGPRDFLFTSPGSVDLMRHNGWLYPRVFKPAAHRAGLPSGLRFHDLRHTCAALLIAENVPAKAIQTHLGHSSFAITMDRYGHLFPSAADVVAAALETAFETGS